MDYGDGSGPLAGTAAAGTCTGPAHVYADEGTGSYTVTVSVSDNDGGNDTNSTSHTVTNVNPTVNTPTVAPPTSTEGGSATASATFTDPGTLDTHTCTVDYGDGTGPQTGTVVGNTCTGPAHTWADNGTFTITVSVTDNDGGNGFNSTTYTVSNADPVVGTVTTNTPTAEGSLATASASFTDAGTADTHTCSINWGDGSPASPGTVTQGAGTGSCSGTHTYADDGSFTVTITITDDDGGVGSNSATHVVTNLPPTITNVSVSPEPSTEGNVDTVTATFTDPGTADVHTCTINWGDGSPVAAGTVAAGSCTGTHTYADNGSYTVSVTIDDGDGGSDTESDDPRREQRSAGYYGSHGLPGALPRGRPGQPLGALHGSGNGGHAHLHDQLGRRLPDSARNHFRRRLHGLSHLRGRGFLHGHGHGHG